MNEKTVLETIRKYALWAVLAAAALLLILEILKVWNLIDTTSGGSISNIGDLAMNALMGGQLGSDMFNFSSPSPNVWGHIEETLAIVLALGSVSLLAILVSSRTKLGKSAKAATAPAKAATPVATAKAAPAKAAPARKAPAKPKK